MNFKNNLEILNENRNKAKAKYENYETEQKAATDYKNWRIAEEAYTAFVTKLSDVEKLEMENMEDKFKLLRILK